MCPLNGNTPLFTYKKVFVCLPAPSLSAACPLQPRNPTMLPQPPPSLHHRCLCMELHYFPSFHVFKQLYLAESITLDLHTHYQKQSYQSRCYIATSQGLQALVIPVQRSTRRGYYKDVAIDYTTDWTKKQAHALATAYGKTPYYRFWWDMVQPIFAQKPKLLWELSLALLERCFAFLSMEKNIVLSTTSSHAQLALAEMRDLRHLFHPKKPHPLAPTIPHYAQRFAPVHHACLSIVDVLCMHGPYACRWFSN